MFHMIDRVNILSGEYFLLYLTSEYGIAINVLLSIYRWESKGAASRQIWMGAKKTAGAASGYLLAFRLD